MKKLEGETRKMAGRRRERKREKGKNYALFFSPINSLLERKGSKKITRLALERFDI